MCLPPKRKSAAATITIDPAAKAAGDRRSRPATRCANPLRRHRRHCSPTPAPRQRRRRNPSGFGLFLLTAFGAGLAAIFTPCVFPMIPFTVSYFVNRQTGGKRDGVLQAVVFCLGIIVLFTGLGVLIKGDRRTVRRGASSATALG